MRAMWCRTMYLDVMRRTQIYLDDAVAELLSREVARTGASRSELIRRAIRAQYRSESSESRLTALRASAGLWSDRRTTGESYVDDLRGDVNERLEQVELG
jgi:Arc/MetJ-type ribon-helix-helix transcriptional regulator